MTAIIYMCTFGNCKKIYNTESFLYYILTYNLHMYVIILTNVIFVYSICTIHKNIYVLLKNYKQCTLCILTAAAVNVTYRHNIRNTYKCTWHLPVTYTIRSCLIEFAPFGNGKNVFNTKCFLYFIDVYILKTSNTIHHGYTYSHIS